MCIYIYTICIYIYTYTLYGDRYKYICVYTCIAHTHTHYVYCCIQIYNLMQPVSFHLPGDLRNFFKGCSSWISGVDVIALGDKVFTLVPFCSICYSICCLLILMIEKIWKNHFSDLVGVLALSTPFWESAQVLRTWQRERQDGCVLALSEPNLGESSRTQQLVTAHKPNLRVVFFAHLHPYCTPKISYTSCDLSCK